MRLVLVQLLLWLLALVPGPVAGDDAVTGFHRLPLDGALSQNTVTAMLQDRRGLLWIGTLGGINVYDGYRFRALSSDPRDPRTLAGVAVGRLLEDRRGRIWVAGLNGWLDRIDPGSGEITHVAADLAGPPDRPGSNSVALFEDAIGDLWIGSNTGLHRYRPDTDALVLNADSNPDAVGEAPPLSAVTAIAAAGGGRLWLGTPDGLVRFDPRRRRIERFRHDPDDAGSLPDNRVTALLPEADGSLWIGTIGGLGRYRGDGKGFERYRADPADPHALGGNYVRALLRDRRGRLWVGTQSGGLNRFVDGGFESHLHDPDAPGSLSSDDVWSLFEDRSGLIWIGTAGGGLNQINPSTRRFEALRSLPFNPRSLRNPFVWDLQEDADGRLWMTTLAGLERWDPRDGSFALFEPQAGDKARNQLQSLHIDERGRLWTGSVDGRLYRFDVDVSRFEPVRLPGRSAPGISADRVWFIGGDAGGRVWVSTAEALLAFDPDSVALVETIPSSPELPLGVAPVRALLTDSDGVLWFGGGGVGLIRYEPGQGITARLGPRADQPDSLSENSVRALYEDADGNLWLGTHNGLNRLSADDRRAARNRFRLYTEADGLPDNTIYGILPDTDGRQLWLGTNAGLSRFDPVAGTFRNFTVADGLTANEMNGGAELRSRDGRLYFGSVSGVSWFRPEALPINRQPPAIAITGVDRHRGGRLPLRFGVERPLDLPHDDTAFSLNFAVMDFHQPGKNRFRYRLLGPDSGDWIDSAQPSVNFATLPPGQYRFEVLGANNDGVWSEKPAAVDIGVRPPWWRTPTAYAIEAALLLLVLLAYHRAQRAKLKRQRRYNQELSSAHSLAEARLQMARHYAVTDQLTQLPNRAALLEALGRYMHAARQDQRSFAVLLINLDRFQQINDSIGHALGDRVLQLTGERLQRCAGADGYVARVGSDEFALIAPPPGDVDIADDNWPERLAVDVQHAIGEPHPLREPPLVIGASIGIACFDVAAQDTPSDLLGHADIATHQGKQQGPGNVVRYRAGMHESLRERLSLQTRMRLALDAGEFVAWYQPLVGVVDGRLSGFEALIRWLPPDAPPIYPDQFIPLAEETGLIVELGDWMLREVCRQVGEWRQQGVAGISVAVNVSMRQLRSGTLVSLLRGCLEQYRVPASMIKLEITESAMMENVEDAADQLAEVRKLGVAVSVDDFGTGFSSLAHLKRLPVSELKIDRSFVSDVATSEQSRQIIASIVRLAHELKLGTVGEGVEDAASLACLRAIGCDLAQGYHFAKPMSAERLWETGWLQPTLATPAARRRA